MPDRSASDRSLPADRWSLTVSALLIGGLLLAAGALFQSAETQAPVVKKLRPNAQLSVAENSPVKPVAAPEPLNGRTLQLPPPPPSPAKAIVKFIPVTPKRLPVKAAPPIKKQRVAEPLKRTAPPRPVQAPAIMAKPKIEPLKPPPRTRVAQPRPEPKPVSKSRVPPSPEADKIVADGRKTVKTGGALLRLLEHGQGPNIEIAWPRRADRRRALYRQLSHCYGVRAAVMAGGTRLFSDVGLPGQGWSIDMDRFSGFIRSPQGEQISEETRAFARIASRHHLTDWRPVRVFPRSVDAALLGGLGTVLGPLYKTAKQIRAAYRWDRSQLILTDFTVDGRTLAGAVTLPLPSRRMRGAGCD
jgi:hypothetical protein